MKSWHISQLFFPVFLTFPTDIKKKQTFTPCITLPQFFWLSENPRGRPRKKIRQGGLWYTIVMRSVVATETGGNYSGNMEQPKMSAFSQCLCKLLLLTESHQRGVYHWPGYRKLNNISINFIQTPASNLHLRQSRLIIKFIILLLYLKLMQSFKKRAWSLYHLTISCTRAILHKNTVCLSGQPFQAAL